MRKVKVFQIGLGSFGRHGFEKFIDMEKHLPEADLEFIGVADTDREKLDSAESFAETHNLEIEVFRTAGEMYQRAEEVNDEESEVLVYDAGPTQSHSDHIYESVHRGFYHLSEKPSSMTRQEHIQEKKLAMDRDVTWMVDFIERENPAVKKTLDIIEEESVEKIEVFRESSIGLQKLYDPVKRVGVKGGDILDKMTHEVYVLDFLEKINGDYSLELESAEAEVFMPKDFNSDKFMTTQGGYTDKVEDNTATGMTYSVFDSEGVQVELNSSWLGLSEGAMHHARDIREKIGEEILERDFVEQEDEAFLDEEARFFVIQGSRNLLGDMLHGRLYDLDESEEIETFDLTHDQLYRVLENAVLEAAGVTDNPISEKETDIFMNAIFDVRDEVTSDVDSFEELEEARDKIESLVIRDGKILENEEAETIAG